MSPAAQNVIQRLDAARQKWWFFTLLSTAVLATATSAGLLLFFMLADSLVRFNQIGLAVLTVLWLAATIALLVLVGRRLGRSQRTLEATARRVEMEFPEIGSDLINVVQLASDTKNVDRAFCEAAINVSAARLRHVHFDNAAEQESRWRRFLYCMQTPHDFVDSIGLLACLVNVAMFCGLCVPNWGSAANRLMKPWNFVPSEGSVKIVSVKPGDVDVLIGSSLDIEAEIRNPEGKPLEAMLYVIPQEHKEGDKEQSVETMVPDESYVHFKYTIAAVNKPLKYRLEIGDSQSSQYSVKIRQKPTIQEVSVAMHYPEYLGRADETFTQKDADLSAPECTLATLKIRADPPISEGFLETEGKRLAGRVEDGGERLVIEDFPLIHDGTFTVRLVNSAGHSDPNPRVNRIHVTPDKPPTVELLKPGRQESAAPKQVVPVAVRAGDDNAVGLVRLEMRVTKPADNAPEPEEPKADADKEKEDGKADKAKPAASKDVEVQGVQEVQRWVKFEGTTNVMLEHRLELPEAAKPGCTVLIQAVAQDKRSFDKYGHKLTPQEKASGWHRIRIIDPDAKAAASVEQLENARAAIFKILEKQIRSRSFANGILAQKEIAERSKMLTDVRGRQVEIQKAAIAVIQSIKDTDHEERRVIKRIMNQLAYGEMLEAVQQCDELVKQKALEGFQGPMPILLASQDKVIETLRKMLDAARHAETEALAEMKKRPGGDLPDDTKKKLEALKKKMEDFAKQQKKVIEASEALAKKPVEDFTEEDEQLLKTLAANEDNWAKFMKDFHSDLSKLPEQDFANGSMAKEAVEIQTELKMAEDALLKKSADIAVPLEQLGYEMAKEITTNMEKWLPDTPDREKWSQEEAMTDKDKEAPMAELPGELEDLIGDLMEEEEDLFDEMEDVSSSAADSPDKGVGWDAADGPISSMSAKGVTGNRLPNTSEIGGRAGEGRQGKSSGEFVGDEAVGKGGRNTPARLTPDPIMKGQIKDHSKDPTGGATGGGKESGQGGEGLEGPAPNAPGARELQRLAGKQAALRNKAEAVDVQFQVSSFHHTDLKKLIEAMGQIEADLKSGNYQNALRTRKLMTERAANVKQYLEGEFQVRKDNTANLPGDIQKEILGGMQDPSPQGWEELNRRYFERLAGTSGTPAGSGAAPEARAAADTPDKKPAPAPTAKGEAEKK